MVRSWVEDAEVLSEEGGESGVEVNVRGPRELLEDEESFQSFRGSRKGTASPRRSYTEEYELVLPSGPRNTCFLLSPAVLAGTVL